MGQCDDVTVIICTWNRVKLLEETLIFLGGIDAPSTFRREVVVVDNNSIDATRDLVARVSASFPTRLDYVFEPRQGKSHAMNAGARASTGSVLAFVDDDVRVGREWLTAVAGSFGDHPDIGYIGGPVDPIWEEPCPWWFARTGKVLWGTLAILDYGSEPFVFEERRRIPLGANFALRRALFDGLGGFDPTFGRNSESILLGQELPEFFARARRVGVRGRYVPAMRVQHHVPAGRLRPDYFRRWWYGKGISRARLERAHPVTELGLDLRRVPTVAGIPRFLFGTAARDAARWLNAAVRGDRAARFSAETQLCYFGGQLRERLRQR